MLLSINALNANDLKPMLQIGYDFGGKTLATVEQFDYFSGYDIARVRAGEGLSLEVGATIENDNKDFEFQFLVGYKFDQESAENGSVTWDIIPFTALALMKKDKWKFGGGLTYHLNPEISGNFSGFNRNNNFFNDSIDDQYENALGGVVQVQYKVSDSTAIGVRGTFMEYTLKRNPSVVASGNSIGINFSYTFGERSEFR